MIPTAYALHEVEIADHRRTMEATAARERLASEIRSGDPCRRTAIGQLLRAAGAAARWRRPAVRIPHAGPCTSPC